jgi:hypothetical protein
MATGSDGSTRASEQTLIVPRRLFTEEFLAYLAERDEPSTAAEAEATGRRHVVPDPQGGWAVLREGESLEAGDVPEATFLREEAAMIAAAVLPGVARRLRYQLGDDPCERGFPVLFDGAVVGHSRIFNDALVAAMTVLDALVASPHEFGWLLLALGATALERVEKVTAGRLGRP